MSAESLLIYLTRLVYLFVFVRVLAEAIRHPRRVKVDVAIFFGLPTIVILLSVLDEIGVGLPTQLVEAINISLVLSLAYFLLRLVDDFASVPAPLLSGAGAMALLLAVAAFLFAPPRPGWLIVAQQLYFVGFLLYGAVRVMQETARATGVTRRRLHAVVFGILSLGMTILISGLRLLLPVPDDLARLVMQSFALGSALGFFIGFATPNALRRAWQEPELRAFLGRAATLPRLPTTEAIIERLEKGAAATTGAPWARVGLWEPNNQRLYFPSATHGPSYYDLDAELPAVQAFVQQEALFIEDGLQQFPAYQDLLREAGATTIIASPIIAGTRPLGVLVVYGPGVTLFADDDLDLVRLLGVQAAVVLENRYLIEEAARVQAREEATRLKEDFLSAAAHDLKTPLTTLVAQSQLLERKAVRAPDAPIDLKAVQRLSGEALRLRDLVLELLDASRAEQGRLLGTREVVDLVALARQSCERGATPRHACTVIGAESVWGRYDAARISQLIDNLLENAIKYSPDGGTVSIRVWQEGEEARLEIADQGIGIPSEEMPHLFDRFYRGSNVDDRRFAGMGLGLFICQAIAQQHGGRIWATSEPGCGSTFHVALPGGEREQDEWSTHTHSGR